MEDRVTLKNLVGSGGFKQPIKPKTWTPLVADDYTIKVAMPDGSTSINVWISFNQSALVTDRAKNFQFRVVREGGDFTARQSILMPSVTDVGLTYEWELNTGPTNPNTIWIEVWHDGKVNIDIDGYEAHYKHGPEVIVK